MEEDEHLYGVADEELPNGAHGWHGGKLATTVDNEEQLEALQAMKADDNLLSFALSCKAAEAKMTANQLRGVQATISECNLLRLVLGMTEKDADGNDILRFDADRYAIDDTLLHAGKVAFPRQLAFQHRGKTPSADNDPRPESIPRDVFITKSETLTVNGKKRVMRQLVDRHPDYLADRTLQEVLAMLKTELENSRAARVMQRRDQDGAQEEDPGGPESIWDVLGRYVDGDAEDDENGEYYYEPLPFLRREVIDDLKIHFAAGEKGIAIALLDIVKTSNHPLVQGKGLRVGCCMYERTGDRVRELSSAHFDTEHAWKLADCVPHNGGNCTYNQVFNAGRCFEGFIENFLRAVLRNCANEVSVTFSGAHFALNRDREDEDEGLEAAHEDVMQDYSSHIVGSHLGESVVIPVFSIYILHTRKSLGDYRREAMVGERSSSTEDRDFDEKCNMIEVHLLSADPDLVGDAILPFEGVNLTDDQKKINKFLRRQRALWRRGKLKAWKYEKLQTIVANCSDDFMGDGTAYQTPEEIWRECYNRVNLFLSNFESAAASAPAALSRILTLDIDLRGWVVENMFWTHTRMVYSRRLKLLKALVPNPNYQQDQDEQQRDFWIEMADSHIGENSYGAINGVSTRRQRVAERRCVCGQRHNRSSSRTFNVKCGDANCPAGVLGYYVTSRCIGISRLEYRRKGAEWKCSMCQPPQENPPEADAMIEEADVAA